MTTLVTPHVNFRTEAREALTFWAAAIGGETVVVTYGDAHDPSGAAELVIWGQAHNAAGVRIMAYDVQTELAYDQGVNSSYIVLACSDEAEVRSYFDGLSDGAEIEVEVGPSPFSPMYGKLRDRFGVVWVIQQTPES